MRSALSLKWKDKQMYVRPKNENKNNEKEEIIHNKVKELCQIRDWE